MTDKQIEAIRTAATWAEGVSEPAVVWQHDLGHYLVYAIAVPHRPMWTVMDNVEKAIKAATGAGRDDVRVAVFAAGASMEEQLKRIAGRVVSR